MILSFSWYNVLWNRKLARWYLSHICIYQIKQKILLWNKIGLQSLKSVTIIFFISFQIKPSRSRWCGYKCITWLSEHYNNIIILTIWCLYGIPKITMPNHPISSHVLFGRMINNLISVTKIKRQKFLKKKKITHLHKLYHSLVIVCQLWHYLAIIIKLREKTGARCHNLSILYIYLCRTYIYKYILIIIATARPIELIYMSIACDYSYLRKLYYNNLEHVHTLNHRELSIVFGFAKHNIFVFQR